MFVEISDIVLCYLLPCLIVVVLNVLIFSKVNENVFSKKSKSNGSSYSTLSTGNVVSEKATKFKMFGSNNETTTLKPDAGKKIKFSKKTSTLPSIVKVAQNGAPAAFSNSGSSAKSVNSTSGATRILLVLPLVYITLNTPFYLIRLADTIALNMFNSTEFSIQGGLNNRYIRWLNNGAHYLYYENFACDVIVYALSR